MLKVSHLAAAQLIQDSRMNAGSFVSVTFVKKNGEESKIRGLLRNSPGSHKNAPELVTIERIGNRDKNKTFKSINVNRIIEVRTKKQVLKLTSN